MTRIINLFAGPGVGKSTVAAQTFALMKTEGASVELVTEYAKDLVWDNSRMDNQVAILGEQDKRLYRLLGKVDYVITDSPLLLRALYVVPGSRHDSAAWTNTLLWAHRSYDSQNFLLTRRKDIPYDASGRNQGSLEEAQQYDEMCRHFLKRYGIGFTEATVGPYTASFIIEQLKAHDSWARLGGYYGEIRNGTD